MAYVFPMFVKLSRKKCLIVGGGLVAYRKIQNLEPCGANIMVISPEVVEEIAQWALEGKIQWIRREFVAQDLEGVFLVFAATNNFQVNKTIAELCREQQILANIADNPAECDFFVPAVLRRKSLQVAVSTEGKSPLLARELRRKIAKFIPEEYGELVEILGDERKKIQEMGLEYPERRLLYEALVNSDIIDLLKAGEKEIVRERLRECMSSLPE